ncbi:MAG: T9SS type A sorting domain-containing protein [Saprospiraceae bacterium]|nr:T9SS type A sorting domain-containing protein [Saprospiraceae bacterium]
MENTFFTNYQWKVIDGIYLHAYDCEIACIPQGTPCDDNDPLTYNDIYNTDCACAGTPCPNGDCTGLGSDPSFPAYDKCAPTDKHSNNPEDAWLSCSPSPNPNTARGTTHWIQYDFGNIVGLSQTQIWNYNVNDDLGRGFREVAIDYSEDGVNWTQLGTYNWAQATGLDGYEGFVGPDFGGVNARYVLITALSNWDGSNCMGFSQIEFSTVTPECPQAGQVCSSQGEPLAVYNINCQCVPLSVPFNDCIAGELNLNANPITTGNYSAIFTITSTGTIQNTATVNMVAGESITLLPGFTAANGSNFTAVIIVCAPSDNNAKDATLATLNDEVPTIGLQLEEAKTTIASEVTDLTVSPSPSDTWTSINFTLPTNTKVNLSLWDSAGRLVETLANNQFFEQGIHQKSFPAHRIPSGIYFVLLKTETTILTKQLVVVGTL